jgi:hypothetical protein
MYTLVVRAQDLPDALRASVHSLCLDKKTKKVVRALCPTSTAVLFSAFPFLSGTASVSDDCQGSRHQ